MALINSNLYTAKAGPNVDLVVLKGQISGLEELVPRGHWYY